MDTLPNEISLAVSQLSDDEDAALLGCASIRMLAIWRSRIREFFNRYRLPGHPEGVDTIDAMNEGRALMTAIGIHPLLTATERTTYWPHSRMTIAMEPCRPDVWYQAYQTMDRRCLTDGDVPLQMRVGYVKPIQSRFVRENSDSVVIASLDNLRAILLVPRPAWTKVHLEIRMPATVGGKTYVHRRLVPPSTRYLSIAVPRHKNVSPSLINGSTTIHGYTIKIECKEVFFGLFMVKGKMMENAK